MPNNSASSKPQLSAIIEWISVCVFIYFRTCLIWVVSTPLVNSSEPTCRDKERGRKEDVMMSACGSEGKKMTAQVCGGEKAMEMDW